MWPARDTSHTVYCPRDRYLAVYSHIKVRRLPPPSPIMIIKYLCMAGQYVEFVAPLWAGYVTALYRPGPQGCTSTEWEGVSGSLNIDDQLSTSPTITAANLLFIVRSYQSPRRRQWRDASLLRATSSSPSRHHVSIHRQTEHTRSIGSPAGERRRRAMYEWNCRWVLSGWTSHVASSRGMEPREPCVDQSEHSGVEISYVTCKTCACVGVVSCS